MPVKTQTMLSLQSAAFLAEGALLFALGILFLCLPQAAAAGVTQGLRLCFSSLIGALLPFFVLTKLALLRNVHLRLCGRCSVFTRRVLGLPGVCAAAVGCGLVGGYPVGAAMAAQLLAQGDISAETAKRLLLFCVGPGPAFAVSAVGAGMLHSAKAGAVLYGAVALGALLTGLFTRPLFRAAKPPQEPKQTPPPLPFAEALTRAVRESLESLLLICAFVALFSALVSLLDAAALPAPLQTGAAALLEVTTGCGALAGKSSLPLLAAEIAWGGLCVHGQLSPCLAAVRLPLAWFWGGRALHAALSWVCCRGLLCVVKLPQTVLAQNAAFRPASGGSYTLSFCLLMLCVLLLFGSRCTVRLRGKSPLHFLRGYATIQTKPKEKRRQP